jgi:predicted Holliday junction resolvase-like endonuclease
LFDPIDYVIFEGLSQKGTVDKIFFVDVKTGNARLSKKQKAIKEAVENNQLKFKTYGQ